MIKRFIFAAATLFASIIGLSAREYYDISADWKMFASAEGSGDRARGVSLPYSWGLENNTSINDASTNFIRIIHTPGHWQGRRVFLRFGAVANVGDLFVNGRYVASHRGGSTAFTIEITNQIRFGESNIILLRVSSIMQSDILPTSVEHEMYGGIPRGVELITTSQSTISPIFHGTDGLFVTTHSIADGVVKGEVEAHFITPQPTDRSLILTIEDERGGVIFRRDQSKVRIDEKSPIKIPFELVDAELWSPESPSLYRVKLSTRPTGTAESMADEVSVVTGFRTVTSTPDGILINGERHTLRGVSLYHDHPSVGADLTPRTIREDMAIVEDLGANAIRSAITPHCPELYSVCDSLGVVAWVELPFARSSYLSDIAYLPTPRFEENGMQQLREIIYQNYNHPSVIMWGLFSLLATRGDDPVRYIERLNSEAKRIDKTRPTVALSNQSGQINTISDMVVWRQNIGWSSGLLSDIGVWRDQLNSKWRHLRSGILYGESGSVDHQMDRGDIANIRARDRDGWYPEVRSTAMHEEYAACLSTDTLFWGQWLTSLFDFKAPRTTTGERYMGLVSFDRLHYKDSYFLYRALWNKESPTLHIADKRARHLGLGERDVTLRVYASESGEGEMPIAVVDGVERPMRQVAPSQFVLEGIRVEDRVAIEVRYRGLTDSIEFIYGSPLRTPER